MARSTSALHRLAEASNNENISDNVQTPSPKQFNVRRLSSSSTSKTLISDSETTFDSDSSTSSLNRRNRKLWTEAEEACLISGVAKHGENWDDILMDKEYSFNDRLSKDLRTKYRALIKNDAKNADNSVTIFDIRTVNEKVTEVFIGPDWSRAQWVNPETVTNFESLLSDFEKKIAAKQKMISRISPARTPSRFLSNLAINSAVKRRNKANNSAGESSQDETEIVGTPLKKTRATVESLTSSPLSVRSNRSQQEALKVHSDTETEEIEGEVVYPEEDAEPNNEQKSMINRCIIM